VGYVEASRAPQKIKYPWTEVPDGGYFFVPAINAELVRTEGMEAAIQQRVHGTAAVGIYDKHYGVLFRRRRAFLISR
jgi:hypothetical protein